MIPERRPTRLPVPIARALAAAYSIGINHQNRRYDRGVGVTTLDRPVISVGNLSAGGTGKTPLVQYLVRTLRERGRNPVIAMRGYKAKPGEPGDEATEHLEAIGDIPIVTQPDRIAGLRALFGTEQGARIDTVILDDGFQHRKIARDLDIVVIDATCPPWRDALLPLGFLRERPESLRRAGAVVLTHTDRVPDIKPVITELRRWIPEEIPVATTRHVWRDLRIEQHDTQPRTAPVDELRDQRVLAMCGIGSPLHFLRTLESHGADPTQVLVRQDHEPFTEPDIESILRTLAAHDLDTIVTTRKDRARLGEHAERILRSDRRIRVISPTLRLAFDDSEVALIERCERALRAPNTRT